MSDLLRIVYDVAAIRGDYLRLHHRLFQMSAGSLFHTLARKVARRGQVVRDSTDQQELDALTHRLSRALEELSQLDQDDLSVRRGNDIRKALREYAEALSESLAALDTFIALRSSARTGDSRLAAGQTQAVKIAYDDAVQFHSRLGARLNALLATL